MGSTITPVILSGGSGTRLWPASRPDVPKQFLPMVGDTSLLSQCLARVGSSHGFGAPIILGNARHVDLIERDLTSRGIGESLVILEPSARNTAAAIALAAHASPGDALLLVLPSDQIIEDVPAFHRAVATAAPLAADGWLVTFGITPTGPETGYGYIEMGDPVGGGRRVRQFVEKPDRRTAQSYLTTGNFAWNGGIFLFRADRFLAELAAYASNISGPVADAWSNRREDGHLVYPDAAAFNAAYADSIDYAIMEKSDRVAVVPVAMGWSDVGSWDAIHAIGASGGDGANVVQGSNPAALIDCANNLVWSDGPTVSMVGVDDLIVIVADGKVMVTRRGESQRVKELATR